MKTLPYQILQDWNYFENFTSSSSYMEYTKTNILQNRKKNIFIVTIIINNLQYIIYTTIYAKIINTNSWTAKFVQIQRFNLIVHARLLFY